MRKTWETKEWSDLADFVHWMYDNGYRIRDIQGGRTLQKSSSVCRVVGDYVDALPTVTPNERKEKTV